MSNFDTFVMMIGYLKLLDWSLKFLGFALESVVQELKRL